MSVVVGDLRKLVAVPLDAADEDLQPFLDVAALIRSEDLAGSGLSSGRLDQIELYLAAHFCVLAIERGGVTQSRLGNATENYRSPQNTLQGIASTRFGQMALALDTSGTLQKTLSSKKAQILVVRSVQPPACDTDSGDDEPWLI